MSRRLLTGAFVSASIGFSCLSRADESGAPAQSATTDASDQEGRSSQTDRQTIDWNKARGLRRKQQSGGTLTDEERAYLQRAIEARRRQQRGPRGGNRPRMEPKSSLGLTPLTGFSKGQTYKDQTGGLYGDGHNEPPEEQRRAALAAAGSIQPLDAEGQPDPAGKIVMISCGMSNTTGEFQVFVRQARQDQSINPQLVIVDAAQGGQDAHDWADPDSRFRTDRRDTWVVMEQRLQRAEVSPQQVQVLWMKHARRNPAALGEFPRHVEALQEDQATILRRMKREFPNLKLAYLSSRIYAGYAGTPLNPEPFAYEAAWANQWLIRDQMAGEPSLNHDPDRGDVQAPVLLWGPYLWADGEKGRQIDDLVYLREDLAGDGTHPSNSGKQKVSQQLLTFFKTDATSRLWFVMR